MPTKYINEHIKDTDILGGYDLPPFMTKTEQLRRNKVTLKFNKELKTDIPLISDDRIISDEDYELLTKLRKKYIEHGNFYAMRDFNEWEHSASNKNIKEQLKCLEEKLKQ